MKPVIKRGEKQPLPCPKCKEFHGYQCFDRLQVDKEQIYNEHGSLIKYEYCDYTKMLSEGRKAYCPNCGMLLNFRVVSK